MHGKREKFQIQEFHMQPSYSSSHALFIDVVTSNNKMKKTLALIIFVITINACGYDSIFKGDELNM